MYVDGDNFDAIDDDIDGCIPIIDGRTSVHPCKGPSSLVGVNTDLCYTDSMDVKHSIV